MFQSRYKTGQNLQREFKAEETRKSSMFIPKQKCLCGEELFSFFYKPELSCPSCGRLWVPEEKKIGTKLILMK